MKLAIRFFPALTAVISIVFAVVTASLFLNPQTVFVVPAPAANEHEPRFVVRNQGPASIRDVSIACKPAGLTLSWKDIGQISLKPSKDIDIAAEGSHEFSCTARGNGTEFDLLLAYDVHGIRFYRSLPIAIVSTPIFITMGDRTPGR